jgi:hypothetical protein
VLTEKPLTRAQKWEATKAANRADTAARKALAAGLLYMSENGPSVAKPSLRKMAGRGERRKMRRPNRKQSGRRAVHVDRGLFNIATGQHEVLPRA